MTDSKRSAGEALFEQYLNNQGLTDWEFEKKHPGKQKRPDYTVYIDREYLFDVKEFQPQVLQADFVWYDPYKDIRSKIEEGRRKFQEYKDWSCGLVLYNNGSALLKDARVMFGAMLGNAGFTMPYNPDTGYANHDAARPAFLDGGKMVRPRTTCLPLLVLRRCGMEERLVDTGTCGWNSFTSNRYSRSI